MREGECELKVMEFTAKDGKTYVITQVMQVSYQAYVKEGSGRRASKPVLGHPDLKMMLGQIRDGKVDSTT